MQQSPITGTVGSAAVDPYRLVYFDGTDWELATAAIRGTGVTDASGAIGAVVPIRMLDADGPLMLTANGAISAGARVYQGASGKVSATVGKNFVGIALEAAGADNDVIQVQPIARQVFGHSAAVTAGEAAAAGGNGQVDIDTGFGSASFAFSVEVRVTSTGAAVAVANYTVTRLTGGSAGTLRVTGAGAGNIAATHTIDVIAIPVV